MCHIQVIWNVSYEYFLLTTKYNTKCKLYILYFNILYSFLHVYVSKLSLLSGVVHVLRVQNVSGSIPNHVNTEKFTPVI